jgi:tetratricopeptide (TPR) repeat protein
VLQALLFSWLATASVAQLPASSSDARSLSFENEIRLNEAIGEFQREQFDKARSNLDAVLMENANHVEANYYLFLIFMQKGDWSKAASYYDRAAVVDPQLARPSIDRGLALMGKGKDREAVEMLRNLVVESPDDPAIHLTLGVALLRSGDLKGAEIAFNRAAELDERLENYADVYLGLIAARTGHREEAKRRLERVLAPTSALSQRPSTLVEELQSAVGEEPLTVELRLGMDFDDNVILQGHNTELPPSIGRRDDARVGLRTNVNYAFLSEGDLTLSAGASLFHTWHVNVTDFNLQVYAANAAAAIRLGPETTASLRYDFEHSLLGNEPLLTRNQLTPQVSHRWSDLTSTSVYYQFADGNFLTEVSLPNLDLDFHRHSVGVIQLFEFEADERPANFTVGYQFDNEATRGDDFDRQAHTLTSGISVGLPWNVVMQIAGEWQWERFKRPNSADFLQKKRSDFVQTYVFALTHAISENLAVRAEIDLIFDDSNVITRRFEAPFSHDRVIYGLSFIYRPDAMRMLRRLTRPGN